MSWYNPLTWFNTEKMTGKSVGHETYSQQKNRFFQYNGKTIMFNLDTPENYLEAYKYCNPVKSIVNKRAQMFINGKIEVLNRNTDNPQRGSHAKTIRDILKKPNIFQSWNQFFAQFHIYIDIFGYCPVIKVEAAGMPGELSSIWCIPPWMVEIEFTGKFQNQISLDGIYKAIWFNNGSGRQSLDLKNTLIVLDNSIGTEKDGRFILPDPRLKGSDLQISNIQAAYKSRNTLITKKGAIGILSNVGKDASGPVAIDQKARKEAQDDFKRFGLTGEEWQIIITDATLQWQAMSFPTKDLLLFEEVEDCVLRICDATGLYSDLLGAIKKSTFANLNEAKKAQYQDNIIPDANARIEQLSPFLIADKSNSYLSVTYDHLEVLQQSAKEKAEALVSTNTAYEKLYNNGLCTKNDWAAAAGLPAVEGGDVYLSEEEIKANKESEANKGFQKEKEKEKEQKK